jgi:copper chaperone CopZ
MFNLNLTKMKKTILISVLLITLGFCNLQAQEKKAKTESNDAEVTLSVKMHCNDCAEKVKKQLAFTKGVKDVSTDLEKQEVTVKYRNDKTDSEHLISSLSEIGYSAQVATKGCSAQKSKACCNNHAKTESGCKMKKEVKE